MANTELVYRMRTCAAVLANTGEPSLLLLRDAADLLVEASNLLDAPEPLWPTLNWSTAMRTCAAVLANTGEPSLLLLRDAADLLVEASNLLDVPEPLGEPMEALPAPAAPNPSIAQWGGFPPATAQPCPACGSIDARTVHRNGRRLQITCPTCAHQWEYGRAS